VLKYIGEGALHQVSRAITERLLTISSLRLVHSLSILQSGLAATIWNEFLPQALQQGTLIPKPEAVVIRHGLKDIQKALDKAREGYSACKLVVML
jgi:hypothetical protein